MKLGFFITLATFCLSSAPLHAERALREEAAARSRARDHVAAVALYREAYELDSDPRLLVRIAHEQRRAGHPRQALASFCSYLYLDAAGELADEASASARAIAAELGNPTDSDHDACWSRPAAAGSPSHASGRKNVDTLDPAAVPPRPPRITKREIAGLITLGGAAASFGLGLVEARKLYGIRAEIAASNPSSGLDALASREDAAELRQKLFLAVGGAALVTGAILYVTGRADRKRAERTYVAPSLMKGGGGLVLGRRF